jgi:hypothetical protein
MNARLAIPVRVRHSSAGELARGLDGLPPGQVFTVIFRNPLDGSDLTVKVSAFQCLIGMDRFGIGAYVAGDDGRLAQGTVLAWDCFDGSPDSAPRVIRWQPPHCADDECGKPCAHQKRRRP